MSRHRKIVMTRTPLRVSFAGGGTDLPSFYEQDPPGRVVSTAIDKYVYVTVKSHADIFAERYRIAYSETEIVQERSHIKNNTIRACLEHVGIDEPLYVGTLSDIPASSGLGSSSSLAVGLLNALYTYLGKPVTRGQLAEEACEVEIKRLGLPIGKQDQYAAAIGGMNRFEFHSGGRVSISPVMLGERRLGREFALYWTGITRQSCDILSEQDREFERNRETLILLRETADDFISWSGSAKDVGRFLTETWKEKRKLASSVSSHQIDAMFKAGIRAGAYGGKLCGAGGGGFLLMVSKPKLFEKIAKAMKAPCAIPLVPDFDGTTVLYSRD